MAKKSKNPLKNGDTSKGSNSSTVFKNLFGEMLEQNPASDALFSDSNPFRRGTQKQNEEIGKKLAEKDADHEGNLGDSNNSKMKQPNKRMKEESKSRDLDSELIVEESKKLKRAELNFPPNDESGDLIVKSEKKKKKRKRDEVEAEYEAKRYWITEEMEEIKVESSVIGEKRKKMDDAEDTMVTKEGFDDESKLLRTIFVGNLPLKLRKKEIAKEFSKFGEVESVRIRSVPIIDGKIPRKGAVIKKQINENCNSVHAYVVFKTEESVQASLTHNMAVVGGNHIRVDRACPPRKKVKGDNSLLYDNKRTVFVGNLPFDVKDEEIYQLFSGIKNLENSLEAVRVVRDPGSSLGKGIAYVLFKTMDAANMIVKKRNLKIRDRGLRLSHAKTINTPSKTEKSTPHSAKKFAVASESPDSGYKKKDKAKLSYQGLRANKSGGIVKKRTHSSTKTFPTKSNSKSDGEPNSRKKKRPSVAARKEKARGAASGSKVAGTKRKLGNRTPQSSGQQKKARKFR